MTAACTIARLGEFVTDATPPASARVRAAAALLDTVGVTLAGSREPSAVIVQQATAARDRDGCRVLGTPLLASPQDAALANGTAAHALDYDDMCFVSLAHPSAPLVGAALAAAELGGCSGRTLLDAYVVGFEIETRLGPVMNPAHYQHGWHCTSTLGSIGAAATAARVLGLDPVPAGHALAIAASEASGLKENFGTMVKPLHAGLAARNGVLAAQLARGGMTASDRALDGAQGLLAAMQSEHASLEPAIADLGSRWEIIETGITVKLYPSCAATHPMLDALLDLRGRARFGADDVRIVDIRVDSITPTVLIYDHPATGLEGKFSMPYCAAAAIIDGRVGIDTFDDGRLRDRAIAALMARITMRVDASLDGIGPPLTEARISVALADGRALHADAHGAHGYPDRPASDQELAEKFLDCARRVLGEPAAERALAAIRDVERLSDVRALTALLIA